MINPKALPGWLARAGVLVLAVFATSCGDDDNGTNPPTTGTISVTAATTGDDLDADGYTVSVDGGAGQALAINGSVSFPNLSAGSHEVEVTGIAANCTVTGDNPRSVSVTAGSTATTTFAVTCAPVVTQGDLAVTTATSGTNVDADGYTVSVDGGAAQAIGTDATVTVSGLDAGDHTVELGDVAANCTVAGDNPRTVAVSAGGTATTQFDVTCTDLVGSLKIVNATTGTQLDDQYTVSLDGGVLPAALLANDSVTVADLAAGDHTVELGDVAANCTVAGDNPRTVTIVEGSELRTQFDVACAGGTLEVTTSTWGLGLDADGYSLVIDAGTPQAIAINETQTVALATGDYSVELQGLAANCTVQNGTNPRTETVSDGGTTSAQFDVFCFQTLSNQIVFTSLRDGDHEIYAKQLGGAVAERLTNNTTIDRTPDVAPDGSSVVFQSNRSGIADIWKMSEAGFENLTSTPATAESEPSWAGDGVYIAYTRGNQIWKMGPDGGNKAALSSGAGDDQPAVSPNGAWVLFHSTRDGDGNIYVLDSATGVETQLTTDVGFDGKPEWWFDGSKILWVSDRNGNAEVWAADFDAVTVTISNLVNLSNNAAADLMPEMKADGSSIVFSTDRDGTNDLYTMDPDGNNQQKFEGSDTADDNDASWSP